MTELKAFLLGELTEDWGEQWWNDPVLVFAATPERAVALACPIRAIDPAWVRYVIAGRHHSFVIRRYERADRLATAERAITKQAEIDRLLRPLGWHYQDERQCQGCGEWSDRVCGDCELCPECRKAEPEDPCATCQPPTPERTHTTTDL